MNKSDLDALRIEREPEAASRGGRAPWLAGIALVLVAGAALGAWRVLRPQPVAVETVVVEAAAPAPGAGAASGASVLNASGYVVAQQEATVSSKITGMIKKVLIEAGDQVKAGQVLARLDDESARADVAVAQSQLVAARAQVEQVSARLTNARRTLRRDEQLIAAHSISQADFDAARSAVKQLTAGLAYARGEVAVAGKQLARTQVDLANTVIRAPFSGVVTEKYAHPGEMISPAAVGGFTKTGVCQLVDMGSLEIDVDVNEAYIQRVSGEQRIEAVLDAYPNWRVPGHVISIVPTANREKATVKVRIAFNQRDPRILPDMGVQVWFYDRARVASTSDAAPSAPTLTVPQAAIHAEGGRHYVYTVADARAHRRAVTVGPTRGGRTTVLQGLDPGDTVVTHAAEPLQDGSAIVRSDTSTS